MFYNTGPAGNERITYARQGEARWQQEGALPASVPVLTAAEQNVPGSTIELPPGWHRVRYQYNLIADSGGGTSPKLDIVVNLEVNGVIQSFARAFVGNHAYENRDEPLGELVYLPARGTVRITAQVAAGAGTANTRLRNLRVRIMQQAP